MQHTTKYQFNLIEPGDTFDAEPLNANARAAETQLLAREAAELALDQRLTAADTALDQKFTASVAGLQANLGTGGKNARIATGSYVGTQVCGVNNPTTLTFDFKPDLVFINGRSSMRRILMRGLGYSIGSYGSVVTWSDNGVSWYANTDTEQFNDNDTFYWVAIGEPLN